MNGLRDAVAAAARRLAEEGLLIGTAGNVSASDPASGHVAITATGVVLADCTADQVSVVDQHGSLLAGDLEPTSELGLHLAVIRTYGVAAVVHTHAPNAVAFSALGRPIEAIGHEGSLFSESLPVFSETSDLIVDQARGKAVARALGDSNYLLLQNHGIVTCGRTIEEATVLALYFEKACKIQLMVEACGGAKRVSTPEDAKVKRGRILPQSAQVFKYLTRRCMHGHD